MGFDVEQVSQINHTVVPDKMREFIEFRQGLYRCTEAVKKNSMADDYRTRLSIIHTSGR